MKTFISILIVVLTISISACNRSAGSKNKNQSEQTAEVYTCPMHPEVKSDKTGKCPKCGMDLVKATEENTDHPDSSSNVDDEIE